MRARLLRGLRSGPGRRWSRVGRSRGRRLEPRGAFVEVTESVTPQRAAMLGAAGLPIPAPLTIRALIDTGASGSAAAGSAGDSGAGGPAASLMPS